MNSRAIQPITFTEAEVAELAVTVESDIGEFPILIGYHGRATPNGSQSLAYIGDNPGIVGFELCVILASRAAFVASRAGYCFVASDFVDEMRQLVIRIQSPHTEVIGRDLVYYWPTVVVD